MNKHATLNLKADKIARRRARPTSATIPRTSTSPAQAVYIDDMPEPAGTLHGCLGLSDRAHGEIAVDRPRRRCAQPPASSTC